MDTCNDVGDENDAGDHNDCDANNDADMMMMTTRILLMITCATRKFLLNFWCGVTPY